MTREEPTRDTLKFVLRQGRQSGDFEEVNLNSAVKEDENGADTRKHKGF
jgi:hypothetical protein